MIVFYGADMEKHLIVTPRFLLPYDKVKNKKIEDFHLPPGKPWLLDSSGFTLSVKGEDYEDQRNYDKYWSPEAYAGFINEWKPDWAFTQDYAFYSKVKRSFNKEEIIEKHDKTNYRTGLIRDYLDDKNKMANVVQGIDKEDYMDHIDSMKESGTLTEFLGIGSVFKHPDFIGIITDIKASVPGNTKLHALGVKKTHIKQHPALIHKLYSIDTAVWFTIGIYSAPVKLRNASLYLFIEDMENFMKQVESKSYMDEFEVEE